MTGIVFNRQKNFLDWSLEASALRSGLCLFDKTICLGSSVYSIIYEDMKHKVNVDFKFHRLLKNAQNETEKKRFEDGMNTLRLLRKRKHLQKTEIVFMKRMEKYINDAYTLQVKEELIFLSKFGLPQLAPFYLGKEKSLGLWYVDDEGGEKDKKGLLSRVIGFEVEDNEDPDVPVFVLFDGLAHKVIEHHQLTPLVTVPSLNILDADKLQHVREQLLALREELNTLLPLTKAEEGEKQYYSGRWNIEGVNAFVPRLQEAVDTSPQLEWANKIHAELRSELHVGNMDTLDLWKLLRDNDFIPDDTWEVLEQKRTSGIHCPTTAIMTITSNWNPQSPLNMNEDETLTHKRKTLDLN